MRKERKPESACRGMNSVRRNPKSAARRAKPALRYNFQDAATIRAVLAEYVPGASIVECRRGGYRVTF